MPIHKRMNKTGNIHMKEYYTAIKKNKKELHELTQNDSQYILLGGEKKQSIYHKPPLCVKEVAIRKYTFICPFVGKETKTPHQINQKIKRGGWKRDGKTLERWKRV